MQEYMSDSLTKPKNYADCLNPTQPVSLGWGLALSFSTKSHCSPIGSLLAV